VAAPYGKLTMTHSGISVVGYCDSVAQFEEIWEPRGWVLAADPPLITDSIDVIIYDGDLDVERTEADWVVWLGFPSEPTNLLDGIVGDQVYKDLWIDEPA
jgi:hypothetical protein